MLLLFLCDAECFSLMEMFAQRFFKELRWYRAINQHIFKQIPEGARQDQGEVEQMVSELLLQALGQGAHIQYNLEVAMKQGFNQI